jgi:serpin B
LSMFIILPNEKNGIGNLEKKLATMNLTDISKNMWSTEVNLALPKFKIEETIDLKDALTKLGLGEIFDERKANFGGMIQVGSGNLYVSKVVQKAFIEVNEEGAEAAAATGMVMMMRCSLVGPPPTVFKADHPFIYILAEKKDTQLFTGRLSKPNTA